MNCRDCGSDYFVEFQGDTTCRDCGLVQETHTVNDRMEWYEYYDHSSYSYRDIKYCKNTNKRINCKELRPLSKQQRELKSLNCILKDKIDADHILCVLTSEWYKKLDFEKLKGINPISAMCVTTFCACTFLQRKRSISEIAYYFSTSEKLAWKAFDCIVGCWVDESWYKDLLQKLHTTNDEFTKIISRLSLVPKTKYWEIVKGSRIVYDKIKRSGSTVSLKKNTISSLCIYVSCKAANISFCLVELCKELDISPATIKLHERKIQCILEKEC